MICRKVTRSIVILLAAAGVVALLPAQAPAPKQASKQAKAKAAIPRLSNGKPDMTGVWQAGTTTPGEWEEANAGLGVGGTGRDPSAPIILSSNDPQAGREPAPYQDWAAAKVVEAYNRRGIDDPTSLCLPAGLPRSAMLGLFPIQIIQRPEQVVMLYEYMNVFRVIPITNKHPDDILDSYMGNSIGRWEGDTLVVDVIGFNDKTWMAGTGTFHTDKLHVTERYTPVSKERIDYAVTMVDPDVLTKPWNLNTSWMLREGTRLQEYVCPENNLDPDRYEQYLKEGIKFTR